MSEAGQQERGGARTESRVRKDWEWFWRIVAGLMLLLIAWVGWVLYQITPRSVVTPLAYAAQGKLVVKAPPQSNTAPAPPAVNEQPAAPAGLEQKTLPAGGEGLKLATEISVPPEQGTQQDQGGKTGAAPTPPPATGKDRL